MFSFVKICKKPQLINYLVVQSRFKSKTHWAKKKDGHKFKALNHFDDFYGSVFGKEWGPIREAMLRRTKYVAVVNNFGDCEETEEFLTNRGAHCLKKLMQVQKEFNDKYVPVVETEDSSEGLNKLADFAARLQSEEIASIYPQGEVPERLEVTDVKLENDRETDNAEEEMSASVKAKSLDESLKEAKMDMSRIIEPEMGATSEVLYQYLPTSKLKGMDDWVPESLHYQYYSEASGKDFPLIIEKEKEFEFPEHLKVYTYEMDSEDTTFPEPKRGQTGVFNYYPMDCGSVLASLALCVSNGDRVLELCAAPGGKTIVTLQTMMADVIVCNDVSLSRCNRMERIFNDYLYDFKTSNTWRERVVIKNVDGRIFQDDGGFDKVLVDVPCTTDRLSVTRIEDNNIFRPDRIKERLKLPELQAQLLANALQLVKPGGAVVYSTCSLSPIQNDGVVHMALKHVFETQSIVAAIKDLTPAMSSLSSTLCFARGSTAPRYGQLVIPSLAANFGPTYFARLVRIK